jgi:hypothetical protein
MPIAGCVGSIGLGKLFVGGQPQVLLPLQPLDVSDQEPGLPGVQKY